MSDRDGHSNGDADLGPLTAAQRRLWFLDRLDPGDAAYSISNTVLLRGELDADRLVRAFDAVIARHESLRTRFVDVGGEPVQEVLPPRVTPVYRAEMSGEAEALRIVEELVNRPFDLAEGHLIRIGLLRLGADEHVLCTVVHHIIGDGWSMNLLYRQVGEAYRGIEPAAPGLRYLDHARAGQADDEAALAYWRATLAEAPAIELPTDRPRPAGRSSAGVSAARTLDGRLWLSVQDAARELRCTPFMLLMTVYQLMLSQLSGQDDLCVGTPVAGRDEVATESVFGYFVRMLILRADLSGDLTFRELVRRTRTACMGAFGHQEVPFEQLVADLGLPREPGRNPLFQAAFTLHSTMDVSANGFETFEGVAIEPFGAGSGRTVTDVAMDVFISSTAINARSDQARMDLVLTACADLFDPPSAEAMADRFTGLLTTVLADLDTRVRELPLVDEAAAAELLRIGTGPAVTVGMPLLAAIEQTVIDTPDAIAVCSGAEQVSYRQLWTRAGVLADALCEAGVEPGNLVAISIPRGPEQIAALLAAWRCGAGYVPCDPGLPARRRSLLIEEACVAAVLTADGVEPGSSAPVRVPDPAYVLFTSGSTGTPKPVLVGRAALDERATWMIEAYQLTRADRIVQFADLGFDTHAEEIWPALAAGATLVLLPDGPQSLPELLAADPAITGFDITVLDLPTAYWQALLDLDPAWPAALRLVILGGEQVGAGAVSRWRDRHGDGVRLTNTYGPTEATIIATAIELTAADTARRPPIGRPIGGVRAYVLDRAGRLVPRGAVGELCLAGGGLSDGYLGRPELTAERFGPDRNGGGRMYRTGDRVRWRRDEPVLEFLGRYDRQLKVRGVRIEPGEVESVLSGHPEVGQAVITVHGEALIAYVTGTAAVDAIRAYAAERLPPLLVPSVIVTLPALPLTANGKIDVAALALPTVGDEVRTAFVAPSTDAEKLVAEIFAELLPVEQVGASDDFFVLGGHSLLAVRAIARLRAVVGLELPVRLLFECPVVADFARAVEAAEIDQLQRTAAPIEAVTARAPGEPVPLSPAQERLWFMEQYAPGTAAYTVPVVLRLRGRLCASALSDALNAVAARHESLRMRFDATADGQPVLHIDEAVTIGLDVAEAVGGDEASREAWVREAVGVRLAEPFDLARGPLLRAALYRIGTDDHVLALTVHHIVCDGWSADLLVRELLALLATGEDGVAATLPPLRAQYGDYALWQRDRQLRRRADGAHERDLAYWRERLAGVPPLDLPTDRPRPARPSYRGAAVGVRLDRVSTEALERLALDHGATPYMVVLAAYAAVLARYARQDDFALGSPQAGRTHAELEPMIGMFVSMLITRVDIAGDPTFVELLARIRDAVLDGYAHQELPFEQLVTELDPVRDTGRSAIFQAVLSMRTYAGSGPGPGGAPVAAGLAVEPFVVEAVATRFDLELDLVAGDGLSGAFVYSRDLFSGETVERIAEAFTEFVRAVADDPDRPLSRLLTMTGQAREQVLVAWNDTAADFPEDRTLHGLIQDRAAAAPDAPAVTFEGSTLSYGELLVRANQAAHRLREHGAAPGRLVAVYAHRSPDLVVALLGVLISGAAYVPLDPDYPAERLAFMLADAEPMAVLTAGAARTALPPTDCPVLALDDPVVWANAPATAPEPLAGPGDPVYAIYTSGSTGQPKGVLNGHRGVVNRLHWMQRRYCLTAADTVLQKTPAGFDVSVWEFFWPLIAGARLVLSRPDGHKDAAYLRDTIVAEAVTTVHFVPSMLAVFLAEEGIERCTSLRRIICSGEELPVDLALRTLAALHSAGLHSADLHGAELHNLYGPTEAAIDVTAYHCTADRLSGRARVPIGTPIDNMRVYVLDDRAEPLPMGVPGELHLAGVGLAHGYLRRPELTAEKFITSPDGQRLYRTGDLARWLPDGTLEFLGRIDGQVKLRGLRIELGEIEAALRDQPGVRDAAVAVREDVPGDKRLAAYIVADAPREAVPPDAVSSSAASSNAASSNTAPLDTAALRSALRRRLPDYMVPATFDEIPELPLSPSGKLDRRRLPAPRRVRDVAAEYAQPSTATQILVADLWAELLGVPRVGLDDDFFDLGGHSLLAVQVVAKLRRALGAGISVLDTFQQRTVRELARLIDVPADQRRDRGLVHELTRPIPVAQRVRSLVCVPYGGGSAVVYQPLADALPAGHRLYSIAIPGHDLGLDEDSLPLDELAERCAAEIAEKVDGPIALYGHCGVGSALGVAIAAGLERRGRELDAVYVGAVFPFARPRNPLWSALSRLTRMESLRSDRLYENWLTSLGVDMNDLDPEQARHLIRAMRRDGESAEAYFTALMHSGTGRLRAPIISVAGDRDPATEFHAERYTEWHFLTDRAALVVLEEAGHYYLKWRADELAEIVTTVDPAVAQERTQPLTRAARGERATWWLHGTSRSTGPVVAAGPQPSMGRFLTVALAQLVSLLGSTLTDVALPLWVLSETGSLLNFALLAVAGLVPSLLALPLAGAVVDRHSRRIVMLCGDIGAGGTQLTLGILLWTGSLHTWQIYPLLALLAVSLTFQRLAYGSAVAQLVPKQYLGHANGVVQLIGGVATTMMPLLAVALLAVIGLGGILVIDVLSYAVAIGIVLLVRFPRTLAWRRRESLSTEIREGFRFSWGHRGFRSMLLFFMALNVFLSPLFLMLTPLVLAFAGLHQVAEVSVAGGVGAMLGGAAMTVWGGPRHRRLHTVLLCALALAAFCVVVGLRPTLWVIALGAFGMSAWLVLLNGIYSTIVQVKVPQRFHGRVFAINTVIAWSTLPLGWTLVGPVGSRLLQPLMARGGPLAGTVGRVVGTGPGRGIGLLYLLLALAIAAVALTALRLPRTAGFDDEVPDARPDDEVGVEAVRRRIGPADADADTDAAAARQPADRVAP